MVQVVAFITYLPLFFLIFLVLLSSSPFLGLLGLAKYLLTFYVAPT